MLKSSLNDYIIGLRHIGHVVDDLDTAVAAFVRLYGIAPASIRFIPEVVDDDTPARFAFITVGDTEFELIQPISDDTRNVLEAGPSGSAGINHVAWQVSDLDACLNILDRQGIHPGHATPNGPVDYGGRRFVYLNPDSCDGLLVELIETSAPR